MTSKHHVLLGLVLGVALGYFAANTLAGYPIYSQIATM
jgi:H+/Cl- antiporter ClcA